jgi:outer membrane lipoprotein-sorting protein
MAEMTNLNRRALIALPLALLVAMPLWAQGKKAPKEEKLPTITELMRRLNDMWQGETSHNTMTMKVKTEFYDRELTMESWSRGDDDSVIVVRAPARERGTATLKTKDGLWSYAPRADRLVRIPSGMLSESWMGSHLTNDDLVRETDFEKDYKSTLSWHEEGGKKLIRAEMIPGPDTPVVFSKILQFVDPDGYIPVRAEYYDDKELVRTMTFSDVRVVDGKKVPFVFSVKPADKPDEFTKISYDNLEFGVKADKKMFTAAGLRRIARKR